MIKKIEMFGFKGATEEHDFTGRDLFVGPNGAGKTRILEAIEFALTGSIGRLTMNKAIYSEYGCGGKMEVVLTTRNEVIRRIIAPSKKKDGTIGYTGKASIEVNGRTVETGAKAVDVYLENYTLPMVFNFSEFLAMNSSDRKKMLLDIIGYEEPTQDEVVEILVKYENIEAHLYPLDKSIEIAESERKYFNRKRKETSGAVATNTEIKNQMDGNIRDIEKVREELDKYTEQHEEWKKKALISKTVISKIEQDKELIQNTQKNLEEIMSLDFDEAIRETMGEISKAEQSIIAISELDYTQIQQAQKDIDDMNTKIEAIEKILVPFTDKQKEKEYEIKGLEKRIEEISDFKGVCPIAGIECTGDVKKGLSELVSARDEAIIAWDELDSVARQYKQQINSAESKKESMKIELNILQDDHAKQAKKNEESRRCNNQLNQRISDLKNELTDLNSSLASHDTTIKYVRDQIKTLQNKKYDAYEPLETIDAMLDGILKNVKESQDQLKSLEEKQQAIKMQQQAIEQNEEDQLKWEEWDALYKDLNKLKADKMAERLDPIAESVNKVLQKAGYDVEFEFILKDSNGNDQIGFGWKDGEQMKVALSSGEQLLMSIGFLSEIQKQTELSMLLLDEILLLDDDNLKTLLNLELDIDNVILLSPRMVESELYEIISL